MSRSIFWFHWSFWLNSIIREGGKRIWVLKCHSRRQHVLAQLGKMLMKELIVYKKSEHYNVPVHPHSRFPQSWNLNHFRGGEALWVDPGIFQGKACYWVMHWAALTGAIQVMGCPHLPQDVWTAQGNLDLDNIDSRPPINEVIPSHCRTESASRKGNSGFDHRWGCVKGSTGAWTQMTLSPAVHTLVLVALCGICHDSGCPCFKQIQPFCTLIFIKTKLKRD